VVHRMEFYGASDTARALEIAVSPEQAARAAGKALRRRHFRVEMVERDGVSYVVADRFRAMRMGTIVSHLSFVLLAGTIAFTPLVQMVIINLFKSPRFGKVGSTTVSLAVTQIRRLESAAPVLDKRNLSPAWSEAVGATTDCGGYSINSR